MSQQTIRWIACLAALLFPLAWVAAAEVGTAEVKAAPAAEVGKLIDQLDSAKYEDREAACKALADKGKEAIPALEKAVIKGNLEVSSRAMGVLSKLLSSSDEATSKAAEESLQHIADSDSPGPARKAHSILEKKNAPANNNAGMPFGPNGLMVPGGGGFGGRIIINGGVLQIGGGAAVKTLSVSNNNGVREIKATEGDKSVKIEDDPAHGIKIESTDKVNGKDVTKKYEAKNVEELKKKQPEGYKLYKEYGEQGNGGVIQVQAQAALAPFGPNAMPAIPLQPGLAPAMPLMPVPGAAPPAAAAPAQPAPSRTQLEVAAMRLKIITAQIDGLRKNEAVKNASPEKKAELKKQIDELTQHVDELRKQLDDK